VLEGGLLTGKYRRGHEVPAGSRRQEMKDWIPQFDDQIFDQIEQMELQAKAQGRSMLSHALKSALDLPAVVSLVLGVKRTDQLEALIAAID